MNKKYSYLLSFGELCLKGRNREQFERRALKNLKQSCLDIVFQIQKIYGKILIHSDDENIEEHIKTTFGFAAYSKVLICPLDYQELKDKLILWLETIVPHSNVSTFKITAKRANKQFPKTVKDILNEIGQLVGDHFKHLSVNVKNPDLNIQIEIREKGIYVYTAKNRAAGGLPVGSSGNGVLLLSGGIDSPVAGWMMLRRGMRLLPLHFYSPPYTSVRAKQKVVDLAAKLRFWNGSRSIWIFSFTQIQLKINEVEDKSLTTLLGRKAMMDIAFRFLKKMSADAIVTGENLGQVASQTVESLGATESGLDVPVFRPLIGMDKVDIIGKAKAIDTHDLSVQPHEDCCTLFLPDNPKTKPNKDYLNRVYKNLDLDNLIAKGLEEIDRESL